MAAYAVLKYKNTHLLSAQKNKTRATQEPTFWKMEVMGKRGQENGSKAVTDKTERAK